MSADPADRTATLQPSLPAQAPSAQAASASDCDDTTLPIDDPDRYEQVGEHARGGLGRVVRAVDKRLGRTVAVKELLRHDDWHEARSSTPASSRSTRRVAGPTARRTT
jgi:hypothetical protein